MQEMEVGVAKTIRDILKGHFLFRHVTHSRIVGDTIYQRYQLDTS